MAETRTTILSTADAGVVPADLRRDAAERLPVARREVDAARCRTAPDAPAHGARLDPVRQGRPAPDRRDALRGSDQGEGPCVARHRLQHAAPVHRSGPAAPGRGRRLQDLLRYQHHRASPLLRRRRQRAGRYSRAPKSWSARCPSLRPATRSPASTWWSGCARRTPAGNTGAISVSQRPGLCPAVCF